MTRKMTLYVDSNLLEKIRELAKKEGRSMNNYLLMLAKRDMQAKAA